jgi:DNA-binding beta-propeller fold protein YncE
MKRFLIVGSVAILALLVVLGCNEVQSPVESVESEATLDGSDLGVDFHRNLGNMVIANRASGNISVVDVKTDQVTGTYDLPDSGEPMYVVYSGKAHRLFVGDRANNRVVVFNPDDFSVETTVAAGAGVFHMWADERSKQLWVNNDIDLTTTVIDPVSLSELAVVPTPADLVAMGGKPHDVILDAKGRRAYVSVLGVSGDNDYVVQYSTRTFQETGRAAVGKDPHVSLTRRSKNLFVPCQNSNAVYILNRFNMQVKNIVNVPGAHGAGMPFDGKTFYTTNISGGGVDGLFALNTKNANILGSTDTPYPVPHNVALTHNGKKLYVTHSGGTSDRVTVYTIKKNNRIPVYTGEITVGLNPFGLAFSY